MKYFCNFIVKMFGGLKILRTLCSVVTNMLHNGYG